MTTDQANYRLFATSGDTNIISSLRFCYSEMFNDKNCFKESSIERQSPWNESLHIQHSRDSTSMPSDMVVCSHARPILEHHLSRDHQLRRTTGGQTPGHVICHVIISWSTDRRTSCHTSLNKYAASKYLYGHVIRCVVRFIFEGTARNGSESKCRWYHIKMN